MHTLHRKSKVKKLIYLGENEMDKTEKIEDLDTKKVKKPAVDSQRHAYQLTINNPLKYGFDHSKIREIFANEFATTRYFCMADEIGENGTPHTHIYVYFDSRVRFSTVKRKFPTAHIEVALGGAKENIAYIKKNGKWKDTKKGETSVKGTFEEWGKQPKQNGKSNDLEWLYDRIKEGLSNVEIYELNNDWILQGDKIDRARLNYLEEKNKTERRLDIKVIYIYGATGTGKTRGIFEENNGESICRVTDYKHPFDSYKMENVIVFEEFRSSLPISDMLNYLDIYPIVLPARYANRFAGYHKVYLVSNEALETQYSNVQQDNPETWKAFLRRIHEVRVYAEDGTITTYDSVDNYFKGNEEFHPVKPEDEVPYEEQICLDLDKTNKSEKK